MTNKPELNGIENHWHLSRGVSLATIGSIMSVAVLGSIAWGATSEKLNNLEKQVIKSTTTHVVKTELDQRLQAQEFKIQVVSDDVKELKDTAKETQKMMIELLQRVPKPQ